MKATTEELRAAALSTAAAGHSVFTAALAAEGPYRSTRPLPDWSDAIEAVESAGWRLDSWAVSQDAVIGILAYPVFRR